MRRNYCTAVITISSEAENHDSVTTEFLCEKGFNLVKGCRHYHPMKCKDGTVCKFECQHFDHGCRSRTARIEAKARAAHLIRTLWLPVTA